MSEKQNPPAWVDAWLERLAPPHLAEEIRGDLYELFYEDIKEKGPTFAKRKYAINALGFLAKSFFWKYKTSAHPVNSFIMLKNYFMTARRSLLAYKGNTIINTIGLMAGIASAIVIVTVIRYELSFDSFHSNSNRIYRVVRVTGTGMNLTEQSECRTGISYPVPDALKAEIPSLENITAVSYQGGALVDIEDKSGVRKFKEDNGCALIQPSFFKIFDFKGTGFKWIAGNSETALVEPFSVVLTKTLARKYFPDGNALGSTLQLAKAIDCKVTGIIEDFPSNTDLPFTMLVSYSSARKLGWNFENWTNVDDDHQAYVMLHEGTTKTEMEKQIAKVHESHVSGEVRESRHYLLQPLNEIHYDARFGNYSGRTISKQTILSLALVALFLLLTGSINYINLATAQSTMRSKEVGLRKVMGSHPRNLMAQFMTETFVVVSMAGILALGFAQILLLNLRSLLDIKLTGFIFTDPFILLLLGAIVLLVTLLAGFYPALVISRFTPVNALRNKFATESVGGISLRKVLVVAQFTITQILVVGTFIVIAQMRFFQNKDMGFNRNAIITLPIPDRDPGKRKVMEDQLHAQSFISDVSFSSTFPSGAHRGRSYSDIGKPESTSSKDYVVYEREAIDPSYLSVYQIKLVAGRNLIPQDSLRNVLINRTLVKNLNLGSPEKAVGQELDMDGHRVTVAGVIDDFYSNSLKEKVDNIVMSLNPKRYFNASVKLDLKGNPGSMTDAVQRIEKIWSSTYPEYIFDYQFFDESVKAFYLQEEKYARLFQLFSGLFLLIGCLGLYGLITFVVNRKSKEVAIRKVLGASQVNVLVMFSREYVQLVVISFLCAVPIAYYAVNSWLSNFAYHIELNGWLFVIPGALVLAIALVVVIAKTIRAATENPVDKLKYE